MNPLQTNPANLNHNHRHTSLPHLVSNAEHPPLSLLLLYPTQIPFLLTARSVSPPLIFHLILLPKLSNPSFFPLFLNLLLSHLFLLLSISFLLPSVFLLLKMLPISSIPLPESLSLVSLLSFHTPFVATKYPIHAQFHIPFPKSYRSLIPLFH